MRFNWRALLLVMLVPVVSLASAKVGPKRMDFQVACQLSKVPEGEDDRFRFFYSVDVIQGSQPKNVEILATHAISGSKGVASVLNQMLSASGADYFLIRTGLAEFSHNEAAFEFLAERNLEINLGVGIVLLDGKKIVGQCMRFTQ